DADLAETIDETTEAIQDAARQAGFSKIYVHVGDSTPPFRGRLADIARRWLRCSEPFTITVRATAKEDRPALSVNGQLTTITELSGAIATLARGQPRTRVVLDAMGLEEWINRMGADVRRTARASGFVKVYRPDNAVPFGPALAVGLML